MESFYRFLINPSRPYCGGKYMKKETIFWIIIDIIIIIYAIISVFYHRWFGVLLAIPAFILGLREIKNSK